MCACSVMQGEIFARCMTCMTRVEIIAGVRVACCAFEFADLSLSLKPMGRAMCQALAAPLLLLAASRIFLCGTPHASAQQLRDDSAADSSTGANSNSPRCQQ